MLALVIGLGVAAATKTMSVSLLQLDTMFTSDAPGRASPKDPTDSSQGTGATTTQDTATPSPAIPAPVGAHAEAVAPDPTLEKMPKAAVSTSSAASRFGNKSLYAYTSGDPAAKQATEWRSIRPSDATRMDVLAQAPKARWLGNWNGDVYVAASSYLTAAAGAGKVPIIVAYNIPNRHCSGEPGGAGSPAAYKTWIDNLAKALKVYPGIVIVEPDALGLVGCLSATDQDVRYDLIRYASKALSATGSAVYLDASHWVAPQEMAERLKQGGIEYATGFSVNVANYNDTASMRSYSDELSADTGGKHYVIDTGRNGQGTNGDWCNALGRGVGEKPQLFKSGKLDAYLWIKYPGESDGTCNGGPAAGQWWADYALDLLVKAGY